MLQNQSSVVDRYTKEKKKENIPNDDSIFWAFSREFLIIKSEKVHHKTKACNIKTIWNTQ